MKVGNLIFGMVWAFWVADKCFVKFIYSEKTTKFFEISTLLLPYVMPVKRKVEILQNFVAFSEYMNFIQVNPSTIYDKVVPHKLADLFMFEQNNVL